MVSLAILNGLGARANSTSPNPAPSRHYSYSYLCSIDEFARIGRIGYIPNTMRYQDLVKLFRVLAGRKRLEILSLLADGRERSVGSIAEAIKLSLKSTSKHLLLLAQVDLLEYRRQKNVVCYRASKVVPKYIKPVLVKIKQCT